MIETQSTYKIKIFQLHGGGESMKTEFPPVTLPKNNRTEWSCELKTSSYSRNNPTILFHGKVTKYPYVYVFATEVFLIKRMPKPILQNTSPVQKLYKKNYNTSSENFWLSNAFLTFDKNK